MGGRLNDYDAASSIVGNGGGKKRGRGRHRVITALDKLMTSRALAVPLRQSSRCQRNALPPDTYLGLGVLEDNGREVAGGPGCFREDAGETFLMRKHRTGLRYLN